MQWRIAKAGAAEGAHRRGLFGRLRLAGVGLAAASLLAACGPDNEAPPPAAPTIVAQPTDNRVTEGETATFTAQATGQGPLEYQWHRDGAPITGAEQTTLRVAGAGLADDGARFFVMVKNAGGSVVSAQAQLNVEPRAVAPAIESAPAALQVIAGQSARFSVAASGTAPLAYQWQRNGVDVPGAQAPALELVAHSADDGALFSVRVRNGAGEVLSGAARLSVAPAPVAPQVTRSPASVRVTEGQRAVFEAQASGTAPLAWQWLRDGVAIEGATGSRLELSSVSLADQGASFAVRVRNAAGEAASDAATLSVERALRLDLIAGTTGGAGNLDGAAAAARIGRGVLGGALDGAGNLWFADNEAHVIRKVAPNGTVSTVAGARDIAAVADGDASTARFYAPRAVALDLNGDLVITDGSATLRRLSTSGLVTTIAGQAFSAGAVDGPGAAARFRRLDGVVVTAQGRIIVADTANHTLREITPWGEVSTLAGLAGQAGTADGDAGTARFTSPGALACAQPSPAGCQGAVLVVDSFRVVRKVGIDNTLASLPRGRVVTVAGNLNRSWTADGAVGQVGFMRIQGIAARSATRFLVADDSTLREVMLDPAPGSVTTVAGRISTYSWADGPVASAGLGYLHSLLHSVDGSLLFFDATNTSWRKLSASGAIGTLAGLAADWTYRDGLGGAARFGAAHGALARDAAGNVYVGDACVIRRVRPGGQVDTYAGFPNQCGAVDGATTAARFWDIRALVFGADGALYVADAGNAAVRRISPSGQVSTYVGTLGQRGNVQGDAISARLSLPTALAFDRSAALLVADAQNHNVVRVASTRQVSLVAGSGTRGTLDGPGSAAQFDRPSALAVGPSGAIWVGDFNGLRNISAAGVVSTVIPWRSVYTDGPSATATLDFIGDLVATPGGELYISQKSAGTLRRLRTDGVIETVVGRPHERAVRPGSGATARLSAPSGMVLDPVARELYVRDLGGLLRVTLP
jgi:sugar lactone lactonase YvrE